MYKLLRTMAAILVIAGISIQSAHAVGIKFRWVNDGSWPLELYNPLTGNLLGSTDVTHWKLVEIEIDASFLSASPNDTLKSVDLLQGSGANAALLALSGGVPATTLAGDAIAFDNTMFPDGFGYTTSTSGGTNFVATADTPLFFSGPTILDLSSINLFISTPLNILDPGLVVATLTDLDGLTYAATNELASVSAVPVPASVWLLGSGVLGLIGVARRKVSTDSKLEC